MHTFGDGTPALAENRLKMSRRPRKRNGPHFFRPGLLQFKLADPYARHTAAPADQTVSSVC